MFVAILPFSHYTYCEAVWSQRKEDLIKGCEGAMQYFGGVPAAIVPDNLIAACACAGMKAEYGYQALRRMLELGEDADFLPDENGNISRPQEPVPSLIHKNIRGREYFLAQNSNNNTTVH